LQRWRGRCARVRVMRESLREAQDAARRQRLTQVDAQDGLPL